MSVTSPQIIIDAARSVYRTDWPGRGMAPEGYYDGIAMTYAQACRDLKIGSRFVLEAAKPIQLSALDALEWYHLHPTKPQDILHCTYALMTGLGMRESSGEPYSGMDTTNPSSNTANTAEAGLFQVSWNSHAFSKLLPDLMVVWRDLKSTWPIDPSPFFLHGISTHMSATIGSGDGADFQAISKREPAFAAYYAAILLRSRRDHWGPLNTHAAQIVAVIDSLLDTVAKLIDKESTNAVSV